MMKIYVPRAAYRKAESIVAKFKKKGGSGGGLGKHQFEVREGWRENNGEPECDTLVHNRKTGQQEETKNS